MADEVKDRRLRIMWGGNSVYTPSGYGVELRDILFRLVNDGWKIAQSAYTGLETATITLNGLTIYPRLSEQFGTDALFHHSRHFQAHVSFTMQDAWTLNPQLLSQMRWIPYVPIDQEPIPPGIINNLKLAYKIVTFSQYGHDTLLKNGFVSDLILEGTDVDIFKPLDKQECRKVFGLPPEAFVVGQVGANKENPPRKGWQQSLEAFKLFHDNHPESLFFYQSNQLMPGGFPIRAYADYLKIGQFVRNIDEYLGTFHFGSDMMAKFYNSCDILAHPSMTEGFGLCAVEAQSCGIPVIVNNCHSMPELIIPGETGEICERGMPFYASSGGFWYFPDVKSIHEKMEKLYKADRKTMGEKARANVMEKFNIDKQVKEKWIPYLENLQNEILGSIDKTEEKK